MSKPLYQSKKAQSSFLGSIATFLGAIIMYKAGLPESLVSSVSMAIAGIYAAQIGAQGLQDFKKEEKKGEYDEENLN